jgi:sugar lactone lactonase YvrE
MKNLLQSLLAFALLATASRSAFGQTNLTYTPYAFTEFAGSVGQKGSTEGTGSAARFGSLTGIASDASGNLFVGDYQNNLVWKVTPTGVATKFATIGSGQLLAGVAVDASGNVYVSDLLANVIYKATASGVVSVYAGTPGAAGSADGTGAAAQFNAPIGLAVDGSGNLYVADQDNNAIRKIGPGGIVTTFAGAAGVIGSTDGQGGAARFAGPWGLAIDGGGNLFVSDGGNYTVRKISKTGLVSTIAGTPGNFGASDGNGSSAQFRSLFGISVDGVGNIFVVDGGNFLIRRITSAGVVSTIAGQWNSNGEEDGTGIGAAFKTPSGIAVDGSGNVYVTDSDAYTIRKGVSAIPPSAPTVSIVSTITGSVVQNGSAPITLTAATTGSPTSIRWYLNGAPIAGATSSVFLLNPTAANQGDISVTVSNAAGSASANAGTLTVSTNAWLANLSARAYAQTGANQLIAGFVTTGPANKAVLIRGDGPSLAVFSITGFLPDPMLTLISGSTTEATTNAWSASLAPVFTQVGAFALMPGSHDTALFETLSPGPYTAQVVSQTANSGVALAEIYDADGGAPADRLVNISARAFVGTGVNELIGGFVISGTTSQTVVIRGDGPSLVGFGLSGVLANPVLTLSDSTGATIATNNGWSNAPTAGGGLTSAITVQPLTSAITTKVGAFALAAGSNDAALVVTLPPGSYTAQVSGGGGATGVALVEVYELR